MKQLKDVKGPFEFRNRKTFTPAELVKLDPAHQQQFVMACQSYMGTPARNVKACVIAVAEFDGYPVAEFKIDRWEIGNPGSPEPIFEYWVNAMGDGEVFWAKEPRPTSVQSVQRQFASLEEDEYSHGLAALLQPVLPE